MLIVITGTPGTGKSEIAKALSAMMWMDIVDMKKIATRKGVSKKVKGELEVDVRKLKKELEGELLTCRSIIMESHLLSDISLPADYVFVLRTEPKTLAKRLAKRKYAKKKLEENLEAEMLDYCLQNAETNYPGIPILQLDTTKLKAKQAAKKIAVAIKNKSIKLDNVDYSKQLGR